ncbi:MAG TPA: NAD(+)/NADH kinase [Myxococcota bacterium]|nr:NAD(+)/NADH kinase [Myxococcota bacterium]
MSKVIGVVLKPGVRDALVALREVQEAAPEATFIGEAEGHHAVPDGLHGVERVDPATFERRAELVLVLGGDGTLIHAASLLPNRLVPVLGVNLGHIGFLTEVARDEMLDVLPRALEGTLPSSDRMRLDVEVRRGDQVLIKRRVLNDAVVAMRALARIATYRLTQHEEPVTTVRGDGVIVATPTGSTAYSLASGGPIIAPQLEAIAITPICPHQLTQRPLVVPPTGDLIVTLDSDSTVFASLDGHFGQDLERGDAIVVRKATVPSRLLNVPWRNYFQTLRTKLRWGEG